MPNTKMLINYVPGEECRVAIVEDGKLEEFHAEPAGAVSKVGNIYVGVVSNVEPAIQAAFIDFGLEQHGFLHVTDIHPRYFPGASEDESERVGKKTPRRERPPIQQCFRRGQEVVVQVLKEGHGTKGPTLTSYLSIPGRFLVMMPDMDKVGVSRKVEDEEQRRQMRDILGKLELPEGFGFILRTAGFDRNKTELKRDLAYLMRLWKDIERRQKKGKGPRLLYTESDLLVRALRDFLTGDVSEVIIDNEQALARGGRFMKIVAPRAQVAIKKFTAPVPLFHAFGVEEQILNIHAREVPLPSGGRLVIDETEALIAIDVNSGKSRQARDAESNAFNTNEEAVDEICRQLRLRDLGGLVINDLIDMRDSRHRRKIEQRMRDRLKRDRARTTILPISQFGILEMTRQRMRGSHESLHFADCPTCRGRGLLQRPDSVSADALRKLEVLLGNERVSRVEIVVSPRVASELLSHRRRRLNLLERQSGKHVDVRVSETLAADRLAFYAYDAAGGDLDVERFEADKKPERFLEVWQGDPADAWAKDASEEDVEPIEEVEEEVVDVHPIEIDEDDAAESGEGQEAGEGSGGGKKKRRRRRRRRGKAGETRDESGPGEDGEPSEGRAAAPQAEPSDDGSEGGEGELGEDGQPREGGAKKKRRRRRRRSGRGGEGGSGDGEPTPEGGRESEPTSPGDDGGAQETRSSFGEDEGEDQGEGRPKRRRRRRGKKSGDGAGSEDRGGSGDEAPARGEGSRRSSRSAPGPEAPPTPGPGGQAGGGDGKAADGQGASAPKPTKRFLYASHRRLKASERDRAKADE